MTKKLTVLLATLALAAFGLAACGDDDDSTSDSAATTSETETTAADDSGGTSGATSTVNVSADPDGALAYTETELEADAGTLEITFDNPSSTSHDVRIESPDGEDIGGTEVISGSSTTASVDVEPGSYTFFCSVDGHAAAGMEGTLTVK